MKKKNQEGFITIYIIVLAAALFIIVTAAMKIMYSVREQNKKDRIELNERAAKSFSTQAESNQGSKR